MSCPLVATCGHPKKSIRTSLEVRNSNQSQRNWYNQWFILPSTKTNGTSIRQKKESFSSSSYHLPTYIMLFGLDLKAFPLICSHLSNETCFKSSSAAMRWIKQSNSCRLAPFPSKKKSLPSQAKRHLYFFPISNLSVCSFASACVTWATNCETTKKWGSTQ